MSDSEDDHYSKKRKAGTSRKKEKSKRRKSTENTESTTEMKHSMKKFMSMNPYDQHKKLVNDYMMYYRGTGSSSFAMHFGRDTSRDRTDIDVIREHHKFLWDDSDSDVNSWEKRLARRYYDKLFREFAICDLSRYKENKVAMRWRIEKEVVSGKGQFSCGSLKCEAADNLRTWEVNFAYSENGEKKNALVKLKLCPTCSVKLNYHHKKKEIVRSKKTRRKTSKRRRETDVESESSFSETDEPHSSAETEKDKEKELSAAQEDIWKQPAKALADEDRTDDDKIDEFLQDLFC